MEIPLPNATYYGLGNAPSVFVKLSEIPQRLGDRVSLDLSVYRDKLDVIWETFGEDRLLYGSDWPNSDHLVPYAQTLRLVQQYVATKGPEAQGKFFWRNSITAYSWRPRSARQPTVSS